MVSVLRPKRRLNGWRLKRLLKRAGRNVKHCEYCGLKGTKSEPLTVHHADRDYLNNKLENLVVLCRGCHGRVKKEIDSGLVSIEELKRLPNTGYKVK